MEPERAFDYASLALAQAPRLLSNLDREADSPSYGGFDREHWGWKFRDFPITMLQAGVCTLAALYRYPLPGNVFQGNPEMLRWVEAAIGSTLKRQHDDGSFDSVGPNTRDYGVTLAMVYCLSEVTEMLGATLPASFHAAIREAVERACRYARHESEEYAFISNHQALFALAYLNAGRLLEDAEYLARGEQIIDLIINRQSADGWYPEYGGPDPGYESLGISYLARCWQQTRSVRLLESLRRSVLFYSYCVHPDGSVGGVYGSRHTRLYFPAGFEILAPGIPMAASIAEFMRQRLARHNVVTAATVDSENLPIVLYNYLLAALHSGEHGTQAGPALPCDGLDGTRHFAEADIRVSGTPYYYALANMAKGGVCCVFDRQSGELAYQDAGYLARNGGRLWTSQHLGSGQGSVSSGDVEVTCETTLAEVNHVLATPTTFMMLRLFNLTLGRMPRLARWLQGYVVRRMITARRAGPLRLRRTIRFAPDTIAFCDEIEAVRPVRLESLQRVWTFTGVHMGSARYFHSSDLTRAPQPGVPGLAEEFNRSGKVQYEFTIEFERLRAAA